MGARRGLNPELHRMGRSMWAVGENYGALGRGLWAQKMGKLLVAHRYDPVSLRPSGPGEFRGELVVQDLPSRKGRYFLRNRNAYAGWRVVILCAFTP